MSDALLSRVEQGEFYRDLFSEYDESFPQLQGLDRGEELDNAIADPEVIKTNVADENGILYPVPQLAPIRAYAWLNLEHYTSVYPDETERDSLRHYMDVPGVTPGPEVRSAIGQLAAQQGVLVFDHPSIDEEYPERVERLIDESGGIVEEISLLGTQTYYAGRIQKRAGFDPAQPRISMQAALADMQEKGELPPEVPHDGATYAETIDPTAAAHIYGIYDKAFQVINDHPCRQGFTPEEFHEVMVSDTGKHIGKLILNYGGEMANMVMFSHDLPYPWLSQRAYRNLVSGEFPVDKRVLDDLEGGDVLYFPAIATNPDNRRGLDSQPVIDILARAVDRSNNEVIVGFDCCDFNRDVLGLPQYIARLINNTTHAQVEAFNEIGQQRYFGVRLKPKE